MPRIDSMNNKFEELKETKALIQSGTSAIHICSDDYGRIDEFVSQLAFVLGFIDEEEPVMEQDDPETQTEKKARIVEWNYGFGMVDFNTGAITGNPSDGEKMPESESVKAKPKNNPPQNKPKPQNGGKNKKKR